MKNKFILLLFLLSTMIHADDGQSSRVAYIFGDDREATNYCMSVEKDLSNLNIDNLDHKTWVQDWPTVTPWGRSWEPHCFVSFNYYDTDKLLQAVENNVQFQAQDSNEAHVKCHQLAKYHMSAIGTVLHMRAHHIKKNFSSSKYSCNMSGIILKSL